LLAGVASYAAPAELIAAARNSTTYPDVVDDIPEATAYAWQQDLVYAVYADQLAGFKAGLTSPQTQQRFAVDHPVLGVLPANSNVLDGIVTIVPGLKIELEIAFTLANADGGRAAVLPAIELPRIEYADMTNVTATDIIASNVGAYRYIVGEPVPIVSDLAHLRVVLRKDGEVIAEGTGEDALGDPRLSAEWMMKKAHEIGYAPSTGWVLLTGALGRVVDAVPGEYEADYGELGKIAFRVIMPPAPPPADPAAIAPLE
jgi:2-keto-4-pentenoate hydratase